MKSKIEHLLKLEPQLKARQVAKKLDLDRKKVNACLHDHQDIFHQNEGYLWSLVPPSELIIDFTSKWVDCVQFEKTLRRVGCPMSSPCPAVTFIMPKNCFIMLEASARILALCNQLVMSSKKVTLDFSETKSILSYLNRCGFLDQLHKDVGILPKRPTYSKSKQYSGNSDNLIEIREICPDNPDTDIPAKLESTFVDHAGEQYEVVAFTIFSELFQNVCDHSKTPIPGFAALQTYGGTRPHIQSVVSDSGIGILASLKPILRRRYPDIADDYDLLDPKSGLQLIKRMIQKGGITSRPKKEGDGGLGLQSSHNQAKKFNANISVRQESSELILTYKDGALKKSKLNINLARIMGTHVCFDFILDR